MNNKSFLIVLVIASLMVFAVITENAQPVIRPQEAQTAINIDEIKGKIRKAGIIPKDAKYWKEL